MDRHPRMIAEEKQQSEMNNAAKFQSVLFGNALAVTRIPNWATGHLPKTCTTAVQLFA